MLKENQLLPNEVNENKPLNTDPSSISDRVLRLYDNFQKKNNSYKEDLLKIEELKKRITDLTIEIEKLEVIEQEKTTKGTSQEKNIEETMETLRIEEKVVEAASLVETENEDEIIYEIKKSDDNVVKRIGSFMYEKAQKKLIKYVVLPVGITAAVLSSYTNPREYYSMYQNYKERHFDKNNKDDPNIVGLDNLYNDSTGVEKSTYDFLGEHKINYKSGYYMTSVFDLSDKTPPRFKMINGRENYSKMDSVAGITTNLFKKFYKFNEFNPVLKGHENKNDQEKGEIGVIGYNTKTQMMKAGHYKEFNDDWMVSETYEIPLNFKKNADNTINLVYHAQAMRMVPFTTNETGAQIPFPIGITYDKNINKINPNECNHFGTLEGGKVIIVCGEKQLQVNGSFSDMFKVYERLLKENPGEKIMAYLLDNGSYNLPIWDKDSIITPEEIKSHLMRNPDGGTALALIDDGRISPFEYKNQYKEFEHYTPNYTLDSITGKPAKNQKSVIVIHHTGNYPDPSDIIKTFEDTTKEVSAHVVIMKDGTRHLFNTDDYVLAHAGKSDFNNKNKVNYFSLGIEMEGDTKDSHQFSVAQLESLLEFLRPRIEKYKISLDNITTHKIIRNNYIKKHPNEKGVPNKMDLDDKVWQQIHNLIKKKLYDKKNVKITPGGNKMLGALSYQDIYNQTKNKTFSAEQTMNFLAKYNSKGHNINDTMNWITNKA